MGPGVPALAASVPGGACPWARPRQGGPVLSPGSHLSLGCQGPGDSPPPTPGHPLESPLGDVRPEAVCHREDVLSCLGTSAGPVMSSERRQAREERACIYLMLVLCTSGFPGGSDSGSEAHPWESLMRAAAQEAECPVWVSGRGPPGTQAWPGLPDLPSRSPCCKGRSWLCGWDGGT